MSSIGDRIKELRDSQGLGRTRFAEELGVSMRTIEGIERRGSSPRGEVLEAVAKKWPQYSYWLLTGQTLPEQGQISPARAPTDPDPPGTA
ncbi:helix-turn-helix domain-containing protein [Arhodomonas sp. AD133]|uniref:helix-turn-helix domain-containing protein n=1 Tax=Arhodomonas sp. AD133 TaxID=3415009 RepID=UPI003EC052A6